MACSSETAKPFCPWHAFPAAAAAAAGALAGVTSSSDRQAVMAPQPRPGATRCSSHGGAATAELCMHQRATVRQWLPGPRGRGRCGSDSIACGWVDPVTRARPPCLRVIWSPGVASVASAPAPPTAAAYGNDPPARAFASGTKRPEVNWGAYAPILSFAGKKTLR